RSFADDHVSRGCAFLERVGGGNPRAVECTEDAAGSGNPHPDADDLVAHTGGSTSRGAENLSASQVACVRTGEPRQCAGWRANDIRPASGNSIQAGKCG